MRKTEKKAVGMCAREINLERSQDDFIGYRLLAIGYSSA
jgi:hypothetical protein